MVRPAVITDLDEAMRVIEAGRAYMRANGNTVQWRRGFPSRDIIADDIASGRLHLVERKGRICGVFALCPGVEPTYLHIDGGWHHDGDYATVHRIASDGTEKGILHECIAFCETKYPYLRIDTHESNLTMQKATLKEGFSYCGIVIIGDGTPRLAYDRLKERKRP